MSFSISWTDFQESYDSPEVIKNLRLQKDEEKSIKSSDSTTHTLIEGDNYPAMKLLLSDYEEKIDFIYTDPPYNTGKKFTYNDNMDTEKWLSFMERRLTLANRLLSESGVIFIAIGAEQVHLLKILCDKIFGKENFINDFMWLHGKGKKDRWSRTMQQSNLCYAKNRKILKPFSDFQKTEWAISNPDKDSRGNWFSGSISFTEKRSNPKHPNYFEITSPSGIKWKRQWLITRTEMEKLLKEDKIYWGKAPEYDNVPRKKVFNNETEEIIPKNIIDFADSTKEAQNHLDALLGTKCSFDNPKPVNLIQHFIKICGMKKDINVMDFFAGSGTTLEAVSELNKADGGKRKCILIQKPEVIEKNEAFATISQLCYERAKAVLKDTKEGLDYLILKNL